jgi:hypothetical protein
MTWTFNSNEANENNRKEGSESKRTRYFTITDSPGEIKDNTKKRAAVVRMENKARDISRIREMKL